MSGDRPPSPAELVRPELRRLAAYTLDLSPCRYKLDQNESPFEPPARLKRRVAAELVAAEWSRYPDFHADALRRELGAFHGWPAAGVLVGNGSNELLDVCLAALVEKGSEVLGCEPSFGLYRTMVVKAGGVPRFLPSAADLKIPAAALLAEVERDPRRTLLLCSPNNPTGDALDPATVEALLRRQQGPLLLDNAYGEFCRHDYRPLLARHPNLVLLRTFSKAWALAGLRLGYLLADPRLVAELLKAKLPYNLGHPAILAGRAILAAAPAARRRIALAVARRAQWHSILTAAGLEVLPSEANFLLLRTPSPAAANALRAGLESHGIRLRDVGAYPGLAGCLRLSIGTGAALRATREALRQLADPAAAIHTAVPAVPAVPAAVSATEPALGNLAGPGSQGSPGSHRAAEVARVTGETRIRVALALDSAAAGGGHPPPRPAPRIAVGNGFFAHMLTALAVHGGLALEVEAVGDLHVDLHHTVEDVGIALGEALDRALGDRRGVVRFGSAHAPLDEALARAVVDLSGRGFFAYSAPPDLAAAWVTADFPLTLVADFFQAFADRGRLTLHLDILSARNGHHAAEAAFKAAALALRQAVALRSAAGASGSEAVPSTKGTLRA